MLYISQESDIQLANIQGLYFYATWMPFHKKMQVMISKIEEKYPQVTFLGIDVDMFKTTCKRFNIDCVPTVLVMRDGQEKKRITGVVMTSAFKSAFVDICNS